MCWRIDFRFQPCQLVNIWESVRNSQTYLGVWHFPYGIRQLNGSRRPSSLMVRFSSAQPFGKLIRHFIAWPCMIESTWGWGDCAYFLVLLLCLFRRVQWPLKFIFRISPVRPTIVVFMWQRYDNIWHICQLLLMRWYAESLCLILSHWDTSCAKINGLFSNLNPLYCVLLVALMLFIAGMSHIYVSK